MTGTGRSDRHAIRDVLWKLQDGLDANVATLERAASIDSIHDTRVSVRRLRAFLRALKRHLTPGPRKRYSAALKGLAVDLEAARTADVRHEAISALIARTRFLHFEQLQRIQRTAARERTLAKRDLWKLMQTEEWQQRAEELRSLSRSVRVTAFSDPPLHYVRSMLTRRQQRLRKKLRHVGRTPRKLHRLRVRIKETRYLCEDFGALLQLPHATALASLRQLQNRLGEFHDNWDLRKWLRLQSSCRPAADHIAHILDERQKQLLKKIRRRAHIPQRRTNHTLT